MHERRLLACLVALLCFEDLATSKLPPPNNSSHDRGEESTGKTLYSLKFLPDKQNETTANSNSDADVPQYDDGYNTENEDYSINTRKLLHYRSKYFNLIGDKNYTNPVVYESANIYDTVSVGLPNRNKIIKVENSTELLSTVENEIEKNIIINNEPSIKNNTTKTKVNSTEIIIKVTEYGPIQTPKLKDNVAEREIQARNKRNITSDNENAVVNKNKDTIKLNISILNNNDYRNIQNSETNITHPNTNDSGDNKRKINESESRTNKDRTAFNETSSGLKDFTVDKEISASTLSNDNSSFKKNGYLANKFNLTRTVKTIVDYKDMMVDLMSRFNASEIIIVKNENTDEVKKYDGKDSNGNSKNLNYKDIDNVNKRAPIKLKTNNLQGIMNYTSEVNTNQREFRQSSTNNVFKSKGIRSNKKHRKSNKRARRMKTSITKAVRRCDIHSHPNKNARTIANVADNLDLRIRKLRSQMFEILLTIEQIKRSLKENEFYVKTMNTTTIMPRPISTTTKPTRKTMSKVPYNRLWKNLFLNSRNKTYATDEPELNIISLKEGILRENESVVAAFEKLFYYLISGYKMSGKLDHHNLRRSIYNTLPNTTQLRQLLRTNTTLSDLEDMYNDMKNLRNLMKTFNIVHKRFLKNILDAVEIIAQKLNRSNLLYINKNRQKKYVFSDDDRDKKHQVSISEVPEKYARRRRNISEVEESAVRYILTLVDVLLADEPRSSSGETMGSLMNDYSTVSRPKNDDTKNTIFDSLFTDMSAILSSTTKATTSTSTMGPTKSTTYPPRSTTYYSTSTIDTSMSNETETKSRTSSLSTNVSTSTTKNPINDNSARTPFQTFPATHASRYTTKHNTNNVQMTTHKPHIIIPIHDDTKDILDTKDKVHDEKPGLDYPEYEQTATIATNNNNNFPINQNTRENYNTTQINPYIEEHSMNKSNTGKAVHMDVLPEPHSTIQRETAETIQNSFDNKMNVDEVYNNVTEQKPYMYITARKPIIIRDLITQTNEGKNTPTNSNINIYSSDKNDINRGKNNNTRPTTFYFYTNDYEMDVKQVDNMINTPAPTAKPVLEIVQNITRAPKIKSITSAINAKFADVSNHLSLFDDYESVEMDHYDTENKTQDFTERKIMKNYSIAKNITTTTSKANYPKLHLFKIYDEIADVGQNAITDSIHNEEQPKTKIDDFRKQKNSSIAVRHENNTPIPQSVKSKPVLLPTVQNINSTTKNIEKTSARKELKQKIYTPNERPLPQLMLHKIGFHFNSEGLLESATDEPETHTIINRILENKSVALLDVLDYSEDEIERNRNKIKEAEDDNTNKIERIVKSEDIKTVIDRNKIDPDDYDAQEDSVTVGTSKIQDTHGSHEVNETNENYENQQIAEHDTLISRDIADNVIPRNEKIIDYGENQSAKVIGDRYAGYRPDEEEEDNQDYFV